MFPASGNTISLSAGPPGREKERNFRLSFVSLCEKLIDRIFIDARNVLVHYSMNAKNILFINYQQSFPRKCFLHGVTCSIQAPGGPAGKRSETLESIYLNLAI